MITQEPINGNEAKFLAKRWGVRHGYFAEIGGWVYREGREKPVCQGWVKFYYMHRKVIDEWTKANPAKT